MRNCLTVLFLLLACFSAPELSAGEVLRAVEAEFTQTRYIKDLDMTLTFRGIMRCEPGKRLKWAVREPVQSVTLIEADKLTNFDVQNGKTTVVDAGKIPMLQLLNSNLTAWMTGDTAVLKKTFAVSGQAGVKLDLVPADLQIKAWLKGVEITFDSPGQAVKKVRITEASGEIIEITFHAVRLNPLWSPADWKLDLK